LIAGAGVALVELLKGVLAMRVPIPLHGHEKRNTSAGDGIEVGGQDLGGGAVATNVRRGSGETK
jgi:hypothetical protein